MATVGPVHGYITLAEFKKALNDEQNTDYDALYVWAIETASRQVDDERGDQFWRPDAPTVRTFRPESPRLLWVGDFATESGLIVRTDDSDNGSYDTTWASLDYSAETDEGVRGMIRPFVKLVAVGGRVWPTSGYRRSVQVTATWGWPEVPRQVKQATQILALDHFRSRDLTGGVAAFNDAGPVRVAAFNPIARKILSELKL